MHRIKPPARKDREEPVKRLSLVLRRLDVGPLAVTILVRALGVAWPTSNIITALSQGMERAGGV
jgi:hypothetical protein